MELELTGGDFTRLANNFYNSRNLPSDANRIAVDAELLNYLAKEGETIKKKFKVALCFICLNPTYWQFVRPMVDGAKQFFLPGHKTDIFLWSDIPESTDKDAFKKAEEETMEKTKDATNQENHTRYMDEIRESFKQLQEKPLEATVFPVESQQWPMPTLMRYHLMLQQEETLKEYDYIFYLDIDMRFVNVVGDEILGPDLTAVLQPMYALRKEYWPPYEPNRSSTAYIPRPGQIIEENGRPRFMPMYFAGGVNGGKADKFIKAMKAMKANIDADFLKNYIAIWNDESHWNKYLFENPPSVVLTPSYVYPDSLIKEYFEPMWGYSYQPKLMTLTKKFTFTPGGGEAVQKVIEGIKK